MWYRQAKINYNKLIENRDLVASVIIFKKNKNNIDVLLERRGSTPNQHKWALPGGHVEKGERIPEAAVREIQEETSLTIREDDLTFIAHHDYEGKRDKFNFIFATEYKGKEEVVAGSDAEYLEWIDINRIPVLVWNNYHYIKKAFKRLFSEDMPVSSERGLLIVFEGLDGVGKSTQVEKLGAYLRKHDEEVVLTKWSDGDLMSPVIKKFKDKISMDSKIYSLIHATDLLERYEGIVLPALNEDKVVICDRYFYTSYARDKVRDAHAHLDDIYAAMRQPDIIFYCKAPIEDCIKRASERGVINYYASGMDLFLHHDYDVNTRQYYELMDKAYDEVFDSERNCHVIKTDKDVDQVAKDIQNIIENYLNKKDS